MHFYRGFEYLVGDLPDVITYEAIQKIYGDSYDSDGLYELYQNIDLEGRGYFEWNEFIAAMIDIRKIRKSKFHLAVAFRKLTMPTGENILNTENLAWFLQDTKLAPSTASIVKEAQQIVGAPETGLSVSDFFKLIKYS
mmetsp:Transcript_20833/g.45493  ORF Transcript_20833/g.45493 Transcript_20833/m.45493 type:complete len:138 (-) Transcript_20833:237-650(-)